MIEKLQSNNEYPFERIPANTRAALGKWLTRLAWPTAAAEGVMVAIAGLDLNPNLVKSPETGPIAAFPVAMWATGQVMQGSARQEIEDIIVNDHTNPGQQG